MTKEEDVMSQRLLIIAIVFSIAILGLLIGCQSQTGNTPSSSNEGPLTPTMQLAKAGSTATIQPQPPQVPSPDLTQQAKDLRLTPLPTETPVHDVEWLAELIVSSQAITITSMDAPEIMVPVDQIGKQLLLAAVEGDTLATNMNDDWLGAYLPYPAYELLIGMPDHGYSVFWASPSLFQVDCAETQGCNAGAAYAEVNSTLWKAVQSLAPAPRLDPADLRYVLYANALTERLADGTEYTYEPNGIMSIVRGMLLFRSTKTQTLPNGEPKAALEFTVEGKEYEVKVWDNAFTYNGQAYNHDDAYNTLLVNQHQVGKLVGIITPPVPPSPILTTDPK